MRVNLSPSLLKQRSTAQDRGSFVHADIRSHLLQSPLQHQASSAAHGGDSEEVVQEDVQVMAYF